MLARKKTGIIAAGATGVILAAVLTGSASADPAPVVPFKNCAEARAAGAAPVLASDPRFQPGLDRDRDGVGCETGDTGSVSVGVHLGVPPVKVIVGTPSCPDATSDLARAKIVVIGLDGHGGTSARLEAARKADKDARAKAHTAQAADRTEDTDYGTAHFDTEDSVLVEAIADRDRVAEALAVAKKADADDDALHPDGATPDTLDKNVTLQQTALATDIGRVADAKTADEKEDGIGVEESPQDAQDAALAAAVAAVEGSDGTAARLKAAENSEGKAEQAFVDAEVVVGQACKTPVVIPPAPPAPAPQPPVIVGGGTTVVVPGEPPSAGNSTVVTHLPVTG